MPPKMRRKVHEKIEVAEDLEAHVSTLRVGAQTLLEIRNFIPSTKEYGRGITVPHNAINRVANGLTKAAREPR